MNQSLAGIERIAVSVAKNASERIDGMTASMAKGSLADDLLAEAIKGATESVKDYVAGAVEMAAHTERLQIGTERRGPSGAGFPACARSLKGCATGPVYYFAT